MAHDKMGSMSMSKAVRVAGHMAGSRLQQIRIGVQGVGLLLAVAGVLSGVPVATTVLIAATFLMGPVFCGWVCPYGFLQDLAARLGRMLDIRRRHMPQAMARVLSAGRYVLLALFLLISADFLFLLFSYDPRANLSLVLGGQAVTLAGWIVMGMFLAVSLVYDRPFCNHLCIEGAKHGIYGLLRPVTIRRDAAACIGCGKCDRACPMAVRVSDVDQVRSPQCINCMACVSACPKADTLRLGPVRAGRRLGRVALPATALAAFFLFLYVTLNGNELTIPFLEPISLYAAAADGTPAASLNTQAASAAESSTASADTTRATTESSTASAETTQATAEPTQATAEPTQATTTEAPLSENAAAVTAGDAAGIPDGTYTGSGQGFRGTTTVEVTVRDETVTHIEVVSTRDDARWFQWAYNTIVGAIIEQQSAEVDSVSGATYSSVGIKKAVADALTKAGGTHVSTVADVPAGTRSHGRR